jgi:hypothetical protein
MTSCIPPKQSGVTAHTPAADRAGHSPDAASCPFDALNLLRVADGGSNSLHGGGAGNRTRWTMLAVRHQNVDPA